MADQEYYDILGISRDATDAEIKAAFRNMARKYHPDVNKDPGAEQKFKEINEAFQVLSDPDKRAAYDRYGKAGVNNSGPGFDYATVDLNDILSDFFGFGGFGGFGGSRGSASRRNTPRRGADIQASLNLTFREACFGADKEIEFSRDEACSKCGGSGAEPGTSKVRCSVCGGSGTVNRTRNTMFGSMVQMETCSACGGKGETIPTPCSQCSGRGIERKKVRRTVTVPAGVDTGTRIRLAGEGQPGINGGPAGNLYLNVFVEKDEYFIRSDNDINLDVKVNIAQAALGTEIEIPTLDGKEKIRIPAGTQPGKIITLKNKGVPILQGNGSRGDMHVIIDVGIPTNLTDEQRALLEQLADSLGTEVTKGGKSFWDRIKDALSN